MSTLSKIKIKTGKINTGLGCNIIRLDCGITLFYFKAGVFLVTGRTLLI
jgi:hypothetical protein